MRQGLPRAHRRHRPRHRAGCAETGTALVGGETAEHPGLLGINDYDVAGAATGVVEADRILGADRVRDGDVVLALASSGLHSNGYSLVRHIVTGAGIQYGDNAADLGTTWGEALLEPTRLYTQPLLRLIAETGDGVHALSHVTGGGIAANLARVLPQGTWVEVDRSTWSPPPVFRVLADLGDLDLEAAEGTWNLGIGFLAVVAADKAEAAASALAPRASRRGRSASSRRRPAPARRLRAGREGRRRRRGAPRRRIRTDRNGAK